MIKDMTEGKPSRIIISYSIPIILSGMFQQFYNIADSVIAGKYAGVGALAAVGASYPITMLFIAVAAGAGMGCTVIISQIFGAREYGKLKTAASTAVIAIFALSVVLTVIGQMGNNALMRLMNTPKEVFADGALYLRIYIAGLVFLFIYNIANAIFNGLGDSKTSLYFLIFSSILNIILDYVFVAKFGWGVAGVAWATFIAQGIASVLSIATLVKRIRSIQTTETVKRFDGRLLGNMCRIAVPSIFQQSTVSIGQLLIQVLVNGYGAEVIAGYSAAIKLDSFLKMVLINMSNAVSGYTAQNIGAGKLDRVKKGIFASLKMAIGYSLAALVLVWVLGKTMIGWFMSSSADLSARAAVLDVGTTYMHVVGASYLIFGMLIISSGFLRGIGYMRGYFIITFFDLIVRVSGSYILADVIGYNAIWWAIPLGWSVGVLLSAIIIIKGNYRRQWIQE